MIDSHSHNCLSCKILIYLHKQSSSYPTNLSLNTQKYKLTHNKCFSLVFYLRLTLFHQDPSYLSRQLQFTSYSSLTFLRKEPGHGIQTNARREFFFFNKIQLRKVNKKNTVSKLLILMGCSQNSMIGSQRLGIERNFLKMKMTRNFLKMKITQISIKGSLENVRMER